MHKVILHSIIEKEKDLYSALCLELDVASQGKTITAAKKNLQEAVAVYLEDVIQSGETKNFIPRPAPRAEWIKFFKAEAKALGRKLKKFPLRRHFKLEDIVYSAS
ncbi:MAG: type II toxin-antitoxin system HicB family antitoxin [Candidatus Omnitrophica bacterium]|nr:type II toxin-antitoxin system HicB family antitoxin [Candidatus Omnitrophota bacterium]